MKTARAHALHEIEAHGPRPFTTRRIFRDADGALLAWHARRHRKGLSGRLLEEGHFISTTLWQPKQLNWWIGLIFMLGASCFAAGSVLCLAPGLAKVCGLSGVQVNSFFFIGSIPFTTAAYLQLYQAGNAPSVGAAGAVEAATAASSKPAYFGWNPRDAGWLSCLLQFIGTIFFNFNTFDALLSGMDWVEQDFFIWMPGLVGSILFLSSGYLAFIETCHSYFAVRVKDISWWVTSVNLIGCLAFMVAPFFSFVLEHPGGSDTAATISVAFILIGAIGFWVGSFLMWPEMIVSNVGE